MLTKVIVVQTHKKEQNQLILTFCIFNYRLLSNFRSAKVVLLTLHIERYEKLLTCATGTRCIVHCLLLDHQQNPSDFTQTRFFLLN